MIIQKLIFIFSILQITYILKYRGRNGISQHIDHKKCNLESRNGHFEQIRTKEELKQTNYSKISHLFFDCLKTVHTADYKLFLSTFETLPKYKYLHEGIDCGLYSFTSRKIDYNVEETKKEGYLNLDSLSGLINSNSFVNDLIDPICRAFVDDSEQDKIEITFKLHRRPLDAKNTEELRGLGPHNDYDADGVAVIKVAQENMTGGENQLVDNITSKVLTNDTIPENGDIILLYNRQIKHQLTNMRLVNPNFAGYRDVVVMDLKTI